MWQILFYTSRLKWLVSVSRKHNNDILNQDLSLFCLETGFHAVIQTKISSSRLMSTVTTLITWLLCYCINKAWRILLPSSYVRYGLRFLPTLISFNYFYPNVYTLEFYNLGSHKIKEILFWHNKVETRAPKMFLSIVWNWVIVGRFNDVE